MNQTISQLSILQGYKEQQCLNILKKIKINEDSNNHYFRTTSLTQIHSFKSVLKRFQSLSEFKKYELIKIIKNIRVVSGNIWN